MNTATREFVIFRAKGKRQPNSIMLSKNTVAEDENGIPRRIAYFRGSSSIFVDDKVNKGRKPETITLLKNGDKGFTELKVPKSNPMLIQYLEKSPEYGKVYEKFSQEIEDRAKLELFEKRDKARDLITTADDDVLKANALVVFGINAFGWEVTTCKAKLREMADDKPEEIINKFVADNFEGHYLAALAFYKGIVKENGSHTAVVWKDTEGVIIQLAKGETGITTLGQMLYEGGETMRTVMQEIQRRIDVKNGRFTNAAPMSDNQPDEKDLEIARLKELLASKQEAAAPVDTPPNTVVNAVNPSERFVVTAENKAEGIKLYQEKFGKNYPAFYLNNLEWLQQKLDEPASQK